MIAIRKRENKEESIAQSINMKIDDCTLSWTENYIWATYDIWISCRTTGSIQKISIPIEEIRLCK